MLSSEFLKSSLLCSNCGSIIVYSGNLEKTCWVQENLRRRLMVYDIV